MEKTDSKPSLVICDAGPLIHLDELGCLDLLTDFKRIIVPDTVCIEVERHRPSVFSHPQIPLSRTNATDPVPPELSALTKIFTLHAGEWEALRLALKFPDSIFLTDDTATQRVSRTQKEKTLPLHLTPVPSVQANRLRGSTLRWCSLRFQNLSFQIFSFYLPAASNNVSSVELSNQRLILHRNGSPIVLDGSRFPRLTKSKPAEKLEEALEMLRNF